MPALAAEGRKIDTVLCLGLFYHIYDHYGLLKLMDSFSPEHIVIDGNFLDTETPMVGLRDENTNHPNNALAEKAGQRRSAVGDLSRGGMRMLASCYDYQLHWCDWDNIADPTGCDDYTNRKRSTCILVR